MNPVFAVGRRKTAVALARIFPVAKGEEAKLLVNKKPIAEYFSDVFAKEQYEEILRTTNTKDKFSISVTVSGSGQSGQLGAVVLALARALVKIDPKFKAILRKKGFMTRDPRAKERKKPGLMGARKQKSSPKR